VRLCGAAEARCDADDGELRHDEGHALKFAAR